MLAARERLVLDLGMVKNFAEVTVNGTAYPDRLIGDEQLPDDREWNGMEPNAIPQWVKEGKKSPTGRYTFTTWYHWRADDEPLPSGILGPVFLRVVEDVQIR